MLFEHVVRRLINLEELEYSLATDEEPYEFGDCAPNLATAATVQYDAANEPARQLGFADVAPEPFTARQQRQSRMDGGEETDGTLRD